MMQEGERVLQVRAGRGTPGLNDMYRVLGTDTDDPDTALTDELTDSWRHLSPSCECESAGRQEWPGSAPF